MQVAQTTAEQDPVHKLRTSTRRMEALLVLLDQLSGLPDHTNEKAEVHRLLKALRRAAAKVRDLDVQLVLITNDLPEKAAVHEGTRGDEIRHQGRKLLKRLQKQREAEAEDLVTILRTKSEDLARALHALQQVMGASGTNGRAQGRPSPGFSASELSQHVQVWFGKRTAHALDIKKKTDQPHALQRLQALDEDTLHDLRKAAKQCRYMAESFPKDTPAAKTLASRFEFLQEAGGHWHDWLLLEKLSSRVQGKKAVLSERYRHHRDAALAEYHLQLALEFTTGQHRTQQKDR